MNKKWVAACVLVSLGLGVGATAASFGVPAPQAGDTPVVTVTKTEAASVGMRLVRGTMKTKRYLPKSFHYSLTVPTIKGMGADVKKAFDAKIDAMIASELKYYAKGAITKHQFDSLVKEANGTISPEAYGTSCLKNFKGLHAEFVWTMYKKRYASMVITFKGLNAACGQLGGQWVGYQTNRSLTIDTKTGQFKKLSDFATRSAINTALKRWTTAHKGEGFTRTPKVPQDLKACERPGNVITAASNQKPCYPDPTTNTGLVSWMVQGNGLVLTFPTGTGPQNTRLPWKTITQP